MSEIKLDRATQKMKDNFQSTEMAGKKGASLLTSKNCQYSLKIYKQALQPLWNIGIVKIVDYE